MGAMTSVFVCWIKWHLKKGIRKKIVEELKKTVKP